MKTPEELKELHDPRQLGLSENEICIREGIVLKITEESRFPFEFFTFRSPEMVLEMDCFIQYAKGRKCFLDIGALHGIFSMVFTEMNPEGKAYAFEPSPRAFDILTMNASPMCKIRTIKRAIAEDFGELNMKEEWDHYVNDDSLEGFKVKCLSGDSFCEDIEPVDTIKIDVEGMELEVLKGLTKTISKNHPVIFLELHLERLGKKDAALQQILNMIQEWGYKVLDSGTNEPIGFEEIEKQKTGELRLILL